MKILKSLSRKEFKSKPFEDIAFPRGVRGIDKYKNSVTLYNKGTPIHVRGALVYNYLLEHHGLGNIYNPISGAGEGGCPSFSSGSPPTG